jgi:hypothetical protein
LPAGFHATIAGPIKRPGVKKLGHGKGASMAILRTAFLAIILSLGSFLPAAAQQPHWLVGTWEGELKNAPAGPLGSTRTLKVASVSADGTSADATYGGQAGMTSVKLAIAGDSVSFTTGGNQGGAYKMTRKGNTLDGSWTHTGSGRNGGMTLNKK